MISFLKKSSTSLVALVLILSQVLVFAQNTSPKTIQKPKETTTFFSDPEVAKSITESSDTTYLSSHWELFSNDQARQDLKAISQSIQKLEEQLAKLDQKYGKEDKQYLETRRQVETIISSIEQTQQTLSSATKKIEFYQKNTKSAMDKVWSLRKTIQETKENITTFSEFMYKLQNEYYDRNGSIDEIKLLIKSDKNISDELSNTAMIESVMTKLNNLMKTLISQEKDTIQRIKSSNDSTRSTKTLVADYNQKLKTLQEQEKFLSDYLTLYASNKIKMNDDLQYLFSTPSQVYKAIKETIEEIANQTFNGKWFNVEKKLGELQKLQAFAKRDEDAAPLSWPLYPVNKISKYFWDEEYKKTYAIEFEGIEIPAKQGTPLYAVDEWLVYTIANEDKIWLNRMLVIHKEGLISVYLYPSEVIVDEWDLIRRWQIIGYSGWEPGSEGAGFVAGWPNLTYMVFEDGQAKNPINYLDTSVIQDQQSIPTTHKFKYLRDKYSQPREKYATKSVDGATVEERRQNFLNLYGVGTYRQAAFWEDAAEWSNVDTDVGICIAFAESTLWKYLSTSNNIGNVGNNDRGDRIAYESPLVGARLIYNTLNNQYLWDYHILLDYNGYGNPGGKNYATSPYNWQNNVTNCLTMIKWYYVPDDFPVRIAPNPNKITKS